MASRPARVTGGIKLSGCVSFFREAEVLALSRSPLTGRLAASHS